jgi:hypothetical protein
MIKNNILHKSQSEPPADKPSPANPPGNPIYPASEDIYSKASRADNANPETDPAIKKSSRKNKAEKRNEKDFADDRSGDDLDVPGSELDDKEENVGSEDEENNYYSLGGDDHDDLEEDKGD